MPRTQSPATNAAKPAEPRANLVTVPADRPSAPARWRRFLAVAAVLALIWAALTGFRADALAFGVPAVLAGAALVFAMPPSPGWRLSPRGLLAFVLWFAVQSVKGAVDVALRAAAPRMRLRPGFRTYPLALPQGAPQVMFLNTITLLPGTLSAEIAGDQVIVHMLDTSADLKADLGALEARIKALFALN